MDSYSPKSARIIFPQPSLTHLSLFSLHPSQRSSLIWVPSPFPLFVFSFIPENLLNIFFLIALELAPLYNLRAHNVANSTQFLKETLCGAADCDEFVRKLLSILNKSLKDPSKQKVTLGILRSDYMLHQEGGEEKLQQVELNHISCSFSSLSPLVSQMHRQVVKKLGLGEYSLEQMPENTSHVDVPEALFCAWEQYGDERAVVLFVVQEGEKNRADQRKIEYALSQHGVGVVRKTMAEVHKEGKLVGENRHLEISGKIVAVAYFRAGYTPRDYPSESEWEARELIEKSFAIKCPSISYQLGGLKKVQQKLAETGVLERFVESSVASRLRMSFASLHSLSEISEDVSRVIQQAIDRPHDFVLKPQREGGGNNFYGQEMVDKLKSIGPEERKSFILMSLIKPRPFNAHLLKEGKYTVRASTSELGIFSVLLMDGDKQLINKSAGYLFRTKPIEVNESGIAAGFGHLDSPYLVDN